MTLRATAQHSLRAGESHPLGWTPHVPAQYTDPLPDCVKLSPPPGLRLLRKGAGQHAATLFLILFLFLQDLKWLHQEQELQFFNERQNTGAGLSLV